MPPNDAAHFWIVSLVALAVSSASAWKGWKTYQDVRAAANADGDASADRFLGAGALGLGALCAVVIFAQMVPTFFFHPCQ